MTEATSSDRIVEDDPGQQSTRQALALELFDSLLDAGDVERRSSIERLNSEDPALAELVTQLLRADVDPDSRLNCLEPLPEDDEDTDDQLIGSRLGAWRILDLIGRGGMGVVYRAERADGQFEQVCALKLIAVGLSHASARQRFLRERQILARLTHDNIANLIDGGVTARHEPWFAMELVDGTPLIRWCDDRRLGLRERIVLFQQVLDAVRYAHSKLVVHRDLKPSNILVTAEGRAKLLDFGVAKLLEENSAADGQTIDLAFTPEYAAPEQIIGQNVGPAADIFTLGVLLYTLLSGAHPFGREHGSHALLRQRLSRMEAPIEALAQAAARQSTEEAQKRRLRPPALRRALRGGLGAIVQRCLNHDPAQRYISVDGLSSDLTRWLESRPVLAYKGQWRYRAGQFIKRNRLALSFGSVIAIGTIAFAIDRGVQLTKTRYERDLYTRTFDFVTDVMARAASGPDGDDMTVREALSLMERELDKRDLPLEARSWISSFIADAHLSANDPTAAFETATQGIATSATKGGLVQARLLEGQSMAQEMAGNHAGAVASLDAALEIVERQRASDIQVATLSRLLTNKVRYGVRQRLIPFDQAQALAERAIALGDRSRAGPRTSPQDQAQAYIALVDVHLLARRYDRARVTLTEVEALLERQGLLGKDMLLDAYLAAQHLVLGDTADTLTALESLIGRWTASYGPNFRSVASLRAQYAEALERAGRIDESIDESEQARRIIRRDDTRSLDVLDLDRLIARRLLRRGDTARASEFATSLANTLGSRDDPGARPLLSQTWSLRAEARLLENDPVAAGAMIDEAMAALAGLDDEDLGFTRAQRVANRVRAERCLLTGDIACAQLNARAVLDSSVSVLDDPHEILIAQRTLGLAMIARPDGRESGHRELATARATAAKLFGACNSYTRAMERNHPVPGASVLAELDGQGCRETSAKAPTAPSS
jgi:serine/threonine protein kinase/tetratricopeptide (TPR) repeat protein